MSLATETAELLSTKEVAARCRVDDSTVRKWINPGVRAGDRVIRLRAEALPGRWLVSPAAIEEFLAACRAAKFGPELPDPPAESPAAAAERGRRAKAAFAAIAGGGP